MGEANRDKIDRAIEDEGKSQADAVMAWLTGKGLVCPDCGKLCNDVLVERFEHRIYKIDWEKGRFVEQENSQWQVNDWAFHCPHCDSLNIDGEAKILELDKPISFGEIRD